MRLTLRTLLAYLDGILDPDDTKDINKKLEESEFATGLVHRIRDVMRRLRLGAPGIAAANPMLDPNTVAEYLDNTLVSEEVTEFEKVCLESDVHLAEVASCHQILTLVLGEPAEIDPASRLKMYQIKDAPETAEPPTSTIGAATSPKTPPALDVDRGNGEPDERKLRPKPTVPEYLREPHGRRWLPAAIVVVAVCLAVVVLATFGQFEPGTLLGNTLVRWGLRQAPPQELAANAPEGREERGEGRGKSEQPPAKEPVAEPAKEKESAQKPPAGSGPKVAQESSAKKPTAEPAKQPPSEAAKEPVKALAKTPTTEVVIKPELPAVPVHKAATSDRAGKAASGQPAGEAAIASSTPEKPAPESAAAPAATPAVEVLPLPPEPLGRLMSSDQILLRDDPESGWVRVAANQMLMPQRLLVLPTYRAKVTLTVGVTLEILGGTQIELLASGPRDLPGIRVLYGRVVMMPLAKAGSGLRVAFGDRGGVITFPIAESVAALEVRRVRVPGTNPEADPPHVVADLYSAAGGVVWEETTGGRDKQTLRLSPPQWVSFNAALTSAPATSKDLPRWIVAEPISALDRRASMSIAQSLPTDRLARLGLLELNATRPQKEVRWLALRCLGYIGQYHDMVAVLNDAARRLDWPDYIDRLREAVARDSQSAAAVRTELETQYPHQATELYRMLWGYTDKDLQNGEDANLVNGLDDDTLAVRVLSYWNLKDLTGMGASYQPEQTVARRQQPTRRWRQRLEAKEIRLKTPEEKAGAAAEERVAPPAAEPGR